MIYGAALACEPQGITLLDPQFGVTCTDGVAGLPAPALPNTTPSRRLLTDWEAWSKHKHPRHAEGPAPCSEDKAKLVLKNGAHLAAWSLSACLSTGSCCMRTCLALVQAQATPARRGPGALL